MFIEVSERTFRFVQLAQDARYRAARIDGRPLVAISTDDFLALAHPKERALREACAGPLPQSDAPICVDWH